MAVDAWELHGLKAELRLTVLGAPPITVRGQEGGGPSRSWIPSLVFVNKNPLERGRTFCVMDDEMYRLDGLTVGMSDGPFTGIT
jgi:hypothetical protein